MIYTCGNPITELLLAGHFTWQARNLTVSARPYCALAFRISGGGSLYCGGRRYSLCAGDILYMPQGLSYSHEYTDTDLLLFHFMTSRNDPEPEIYRLKNPEEIGRQFQKAVTLWERKEPGYLGKCMSIFYKIMGMLAEHQALTNLPAHFTQAVSLLNQRFRCSDLRIGDICKQAAISETVFRQLFKQHFSKTPVEYLTELRLENARNLIADGACVEAAALESGFSDAKYFSRVVRKKLGCTPRQLV